MTIHRYITLTSLLRTSFSSKNLKNSRKAIPNRFLSGPENHFEVERKFFYDPTKIRALENNEGDHRFKSIQFLRERRFTDIYYDNHSNDYPLTTNDIWLRQREGNWECKVPTQLASTMDSYRELTRLTEIAEFLNKLFGCTSAFPSSASSSEFEKYLYTCNGLTPFCTIITNRRSYRLDDEFTLDLDSANFGHNIGEVEIVVRSKEEVRHAEQKIARLCMAHSWFFDLGDSERPVMGKLSAYISKFNPKQWECMGRSAILQKKIKNESRGVEAAITENNEKT